ncbi:MAG TPA: serine/threonine-protein kinase [Thermoanaerobaculia bacterium]|nr:serine/threonine-protein kinase [Thermoanaerobaculia bacterium]
MARFERWLEVKRIFEAALEVEPEERAAFLDRTCGEDQELRAEVEALLRAPAVPTAALASLLGLPGRQDEPDYGEGDRIDHFAIVRRVGQGGMGVVYEARDTRNNDRPVALKVLFSRAVTLSQDKRLAGLTHPAIVTFHDSGETSEGLPYFVFEFIEGEPITTFCDRRELALPERLRLFQKVCDPVAYAHQRGVIHCDLKPENILVTATGELKLLDFGIAREVGAGGIAPGEPSPITLPFASPEQVGNEETTTLSDVYSLGVLLGVLLTGRLPYGRASTVGELRTAILHEPPSPPSETVKAASSSPESDGVPRICLPPPAKSAAALERHLRGDVDAIVLKALSKAPGERYQSVADLAADIDRYLTNLPVVARGDSRFYRFSKLLKRRRNTAAVAAVFVVLVLAGLGIWLREYRRAVEGERQAAAQAERTRQVNRFVVDLLRRTNPFDPSGAPDASVDELLDQSSRSIESSLRGQPDLKASLQSVLGEIYAGRGDETRAQEFLEKALAYERRRPPDEALAETLQRYGMVLTDRGRFKDSNAVLMEAEAILFRLPSRADPTLQARILLARAANDLNLGEHESAREHSQAALALLKRSPTSFLEIATSLLGLGRSFDLKDRDADAEALLRQALSYAEKLPDPRNPHVGLIMDTLGTLLYKRGDYAGAHQHFVRALAIERASLGAESRFCAITLHNLAALAAAQGQYTEAVDEFGQALAILEKKLPPNHEELLMTRNQLASALVQLHEYDRAEHMLLDVLAALRATLPKGHPSIGVTLNNLAYLYQEEGRYAESQALYEEALAIFTALAGRESRPAATLLGNLGSVARDRGDTHTAEARFQEALRISRRIGGGKNIDSVNALINLAGLYMLTGDLARAHPFAAEAVSHAAEVVGPNDWLAGYARLTEAKLLLAEGDPRRALAEAQAARATMASKLPASHWRLASADSLIGGALGRLGDSQEAEPLLLHSLSNLRKITGEHSFQSRDAADRVRSFYEALGRKDEAAKYRLQLARR